MDMISAEDKIVNTGRVSTECKRSAFSKTQVSLLSCEASSDADCRVGISPLS
ncbi:MAG: hypothetical protein DDT27_00177 [Dehalococcoidia bacterium]|nr:hypothetical protein [Chloroflexota bacterium]MBT9159256.1 hypothetical protein [Chloroflexota bacterium]MBT9161644.1 hypothetical protein [Chloroflexota bacterium]